MKSALDTLGIAYKENRVEVAKKEEVVKKETKPIGRPGTGESHSLNDVFSNDDAILNYLRKH